MERNHPQGSTDIRLTTTKTKCQLSQTCNPKKPEASRKTVCLNKENVRQWKLPKVTTRRSTITEIKSSLEGPGSRCEQPKKESANLDIGVKTLPSLRSREKKEWRMGRM